MKRVQESGMKAQTGSLAIVIAAAMIIFIIVLLTNAAINTPLSEFSEKEYEKIFANNLLLSFLRTDTSCGPFSEIIKGAGFGSTKCQSDVFFGTKAPYYMGRLLNGTGHTEYRWFLEAAPKNYQGKSITSGDASVKESKEKVESRTMITWEDYQLEVRIYMTKEGPPK